MGFAHVNHHRKGHWDQARIFQGHCGCSSEELEGEMRREHLWPVKIWASQFFRDHHLKVGFALIISLFVLFVCLE